MQMPEKDQISKVSQVPSQVSCIWYSKQKSIADSQLQDAKSKCGYKKAHAGREANPSTKIQENSFKKPFRMLRSKTPSIGQAVCNTTLLPSASVIIPPEFLASDLMKE